jgi:hypothetical protein
VGIAQGLRNGARFKKAIPPEPEPSPLKPPSVGAMYAFPLVGNLIESENLAGLTNPTGFGNKIRLYPEAKWTFAKFIVEVSPLDPQGSIFLVVGELGGKESRRAAHMRFVKGIMTGLAKAPEVTRVKIAVKRRTIRSVKMFVVMYRTISSFLSTVPTFEAIQNSDHLCPIMPLLRVVEELLFGSTNSPIPVR